MRVFLFCSLRLNTFSNLMSVTEQEEMPPPSSPSFLSLLPLSPAGVEVGCVLYAQVDFPDAALSFTFIFSHCCVFAETSTAPLAAGAPPEWGAEPKNCLTTLCKLCVYSKARVTGHARLSTSHLLWMIKNLMLV